MSEKNRVQSEELPLFVHRRYRTQEQEEKNLGSVQVQTMCEYKFTTLGKLIKGQIQTFSEHISGYKRSIIAYIP